MNWFLARFFILSLNTNRYVTRFIIDPFPPPFSMVKKTNGFPVVSWAIFFDLQLSFFVPILSSTLRFYIYLFICLCYVFLYRHELFVLFYYFPIFCLFNTFKACHQNLIIEYMEYICSLSNFWSHTVQYNRLKKHTMYRCICCNCDRPGFFAVIQLSDLFYWGQCVIVY